MHSTTGHHILQDTAEPTAPALPIVLTVTEVAALMRVGISTVYKYKDCDGLPFHQLVKGGAVRFYQHEVLEWMTRQTP